MPTVVLPAYVFEKLVEAYEAQWRTVDQTVLAALRAAHSVPYDEPEHTARQATLTREQLRVLERWLAGRLQRGRQSAWTTVALAAVREALTAGD